MVLRRPAKGMRQAQEVIMIGNAAMGFIPARTPAPSQSPATAAATSGIKVEGAAKLEVRGGRGERPDSQRVE